MDPATSESARHVVASTVDVADTVLSQTRGLMFRRSIPDDYALAFRFDTIRTRDIHMLFVFFPIDAVWVADGVVQRIERMHPWRSFARARCDLLLELPAGSADDIDVGDRLVLETTASDSDH
ncbi:hypothetical protein BB347_07820 [Natronorubrum daqingense]|uniref:DUF192 domain-containing protein n=1 Tax=Natronorubrum daqingense TaxID=588898 RepID=A0A1P8RHP6_9EURY|nr:DUF192 domain-containing protein [Natronorubrum daqingense]APX98184.1 hypothetical protein BB347_07820 [Natronorubrum daqingense]